MIAMVDSELKVFYYKALTEIRREQSRYLSVMKRVPISQELPVIEEITAEEYAKLTLWRRILYRLRLRKQKKAYRKAERKQRTTVEDKLLKGYNSGMESAISILEKEYKELDKRKELF